MTPNWPGVSRAVNNALLTIYKLLNLKKNIKVWTLLAITLTAFMTPTQLLGSLQGGHVVQQNVTHSH